MSGLSERENKLTDFISEYRAIIEGLEAEVERLTKDRKREQTNCERYHIDEAVHDSAVKTLRERLDEAECLLSSVEHLFPPPTDCNCGDCHNCYVGQWFGQVRTFLREQK